MKILNYMVRSNMKMIFFVLLLICNLHLSAQEIVVTFTVQTSTIPGDSAMFITGNTENLGNWNPAIVKLQHLGKGVFTTTLQFNRGSNIQFKFTRGTWQTEAVYEKGKVPDNFNLAAIKDTTIFINVSSWKDVEHIVAFKGQVTGKVVRFLDYEGHGLQNRDITIWLPPGYDSSEARYPVLYMHDGQNAFDPETSSMGVDWQADETADSLIRHKKIVPIIIVAINNTTDRTEEYADGKMGKRYMQFVIDIVKSSIDATFRTKPEPEHTANAGASLGGLIAFMLPWYHETVFSKAACLSPALKIQKFDIVTTVQDYSGSKKKVQWYLDCGGKGIDVELLPGVLEMQETLLQAGYREQDDLRIVIDKDAEHNEAAWAKRFPAILEYFFPYSEH